MYRSSTTYNRSQLLIKMVLRDLEAPSKSSSDPIEENSSLSKSRSGKGFLIFVLVIFFILKEYLCPKFSFPFRYFLKNTLISKKGVTL